jgi:DNA-binding NtrC family response regulator
MDIVVDDVDEQRDITAELLESLGYNVETAINGSDAVRYLKDHSVDLVTLDMIMEKDFDGLDTYREIIKLHPGQKAVIISGFSHTERVEEMQKLGAGPYIKKPFTRDIIGKAVREELNSKVEEITQLT